MQLKSLFAQLNERRVIRATVIYAALLWALLQAADVMAGADIISVSLVRWLIMVGVVGFPLTIIASWFVESPWRGRKGIALAGDVAIIAGIAVAAFLFAWQQWMQTLARPVVAVLAIEATDTRDDTAVLAEHLSRRLRAMLAIQLELRVIESDSSLHAALTALTIAEKAELLDAERLVTGTLSRGGGDIRLSLQLFDAAGVLHWGGSFEERVTDQVRLQDRLLEDLGIALGLEELARADMRNLVASCPYPDDAAAIMAIAAGNEMELASAIAANNDNGLLHLAQARSQFRRLAELPPQQRPVLQQLAMQNLASAETACPGQPEMELLRLENTLAFRQGGVDAASHIANHPNASVLYYWLADAFFDIGDDETAIDLVAEAVTLSPASREMLCRHRSLLEFNDQHVTPMLNRRIDAFVAGGCDR